MVRSEPAEMVARSQEPEATSNWPIKHTDPGPGLGNVAWVCAPGGPVSRVGQEGFTGVSGLLQEGPQLLRHLPFLSALGKLRLDPDSSSGHCIKGLLLEGWHVALLFPGTWPVGSKVGQRGVGPVAP